MKTEEWRRVVGFESHYEVSSIGRVRRLAVGKSTYPGRILKTKPCSSTGYLRVTLHVSGKTFRRQVHRLVAMAFLAGFLPGRQVNHKNGCRADSGVENLEWVTPKENVAHAWRSGLCYPMGGELCGHSKLTYGNVAEIRSARGRGVSGKTLAGAYSVSQSTISSITTGHTWKTRNPEETQKCK